MPELIPPQSILSRSAGPIVENPKTCHIKNIFIEGRYYSHILDFGCGWGRTAREILLSNSLPVESYLGLDIDDEKIQWASENITKRDSRFQFIHHNGADAFKGPKERWEAKIEDIETKEFTLINLHSVFTHLNEIQVNCYFHQLTKCLVKNGYFRSTWFLFDKAYFYALGPHNCLIGNINNPVTWYDYRFVIKLFKQYGLGIRKVEFSRGQVGQILIYARKSAEHVPELEQLLSSVPTWYFASYHKFQAQEKQ